LVKEGSGGPRLLDGQSDARLFSFQVPHLHFSIGSSSCNDLQVGTESTNINFLRSTDQRHLEPARTKIKSVNFISRAHCNKVATVRLIYDIPSEFRDSDLVVLAVLGVQLDVPVGLQNCDFGVVVGEHADLDTFGVQSALVLLR